MRKRLFVIFLAIVMAFGLIACESNTADSKKSSKQSDDDDKADKKKDKKDKKDDSVKLSDIIDDIDMGSFESGEMVVNLNVDVELVADGTDYSSMVKGTFAINSEGALTGTEFKQYYDGDFQYSLLDGALANDMHIQAYAIGDGATMTLYVEDPTSKGDWYTLSSEFDEVSTSVDADMRKEIDEAAKILLAKGTVAKKTEKIGSEECYVITGEPSGADYCEYFETVLNIAGEGEVWSELEMEAKDADLSLEDLFGSLHLNYKIYVSKDDLYVVGTRIDMGTFDIDEFCKAIGVSADDLGVDTLNFNQFYFESITKSRDNVTVDVPDYVLENAVSLDDDLTGFGDSSKFYDESTGEIHVYNSPADEIYELKMPENYEMLYFDEDYGTYFDLINKDDSTCEIEISYEADEEVVNYILEGEVVAPYFYENLEVEYESTTIDGLEYYVGCYSYDSTFSDERISVGFAYAPYEDSFGDTKYISITFSEEMYDDWDVTGAAIEELLMIN